MLLTIGHDDAQLLSVPVGGVLLAVHGPTVEHGHIRKVVARGRRHTFSFPSSGLDCNRPSPLSRWLDGQAQNDARLNTPANGRVGRE